MSLLDFTGVASINGFTVPKGKYDVIIDEASMEESKSGGLYAKVKFKILGGEMDGKTLYNNYTVKHDNPKAQQIGLGQLKAVAQATGADVSKQLNLIDLVGGKLNATVGLKTDSFSGEERNTISYVKPYKPAEGGTNGLF